jgi:hypothetical protein
MQRILANKRQFDVRYGQLAAAYASAVAAPETKAELARFAAVSRRDARFGMLYRTVRAAVSANIVRIDAADPAGAETWAYFNARDSSCQSVPTLEAGLMLLNGLGGDTLKETYTLFESAAADIQQYEGYEPHSYDGNSDDGYVSEDSDRSEHDEPEEEEGDEGDDESDEGDDDESDEGSDEGDDEGDDEGSDEGDDEDGSADVMDLAPIAARHDAPDAVFLPALQVARKAGFQGESNVSAALWSVVRGLEERYANLRSSGSSARALANAASALSHEGDSLEQKAAAVTDLICTSSDPKAKPGKVHDAVTAALKDGEGARLSDRLYAEAHADLKHSRVCAAQLDPSESPDPATKLDIEQRLLDETRVDHARVTVMLAVVGRANAETPTPALEGEPESLRNRAANLAMRIAVAEATVAAIRAAQTMTFTTALETLEPYEPGLRKEFSKLESEHGQQCIDALHARTERAYRKAALQLHPDKSKAEDDLDPIARSDAFASCTAAKEALLAHIAAISDDIKLCEALRAKRPRLDP